MNQDVRTEVLDTPRLRLRPVQEGDEDAVTQHLQDLEIHRWTSSLPYPYTLESGRRFVAKRAEADASGESFAWAITDRTTETLMGMIGLHDLVADRSRAEMGYWMGEAFRGHGFTTEAARRVVSWGFERAALERIQATYLPGNEASARVMRNVGMQLEGRLRKFGIKNGELHDLYLNAVLRSDSTWMSTEE